MTNVKFSQFQKATQSKDTDEIAILQDGVNKMIPSPVLESKIINKTVTRVIDQGGASLNIINPIGVVSTYADLATITPTPELNDAYQVEADGLVYVYTENGFQAEGNGFKVQAEPTGVVEEGNTQAVSGGEVYNKISEIATKSYIFEKDVIGYYSGINTYFDNTRTFTGFGFNYGILKNFNQITIKVGQIVGTSNVVSEVNIKIRKNDYTGEQLAFVTKSVSIPEGEIHDITFDFPFIENNDNSTIWIEFWCNGITGLFESTLPATDYRFKDTPRPYSDFESGSGVGFSPRPPFALSINQGESYMKFDDKNISDSVDLNDEKPVKSSAVAEYLKNIDSVIQPIFVNENINVLGSDIKGTSTSTFSGWGQLYGKLSQFNRLGYIFNAYDALNIPTVVRCVIRKNSYNGDILFDITKNVELEHNVPKKIYFDLQNVFENDGNDDIFISYSADGYFSLYAQMGVLPNTERVRYSIPKNTINLTSVTTTDSTLYTELVKANVEYHNSDDELKYIEEKIIKGFETPNLLLSSKVWLYPSFQYNIYNKNVCVPDFGDNLNNYRLDFNGSVGAQFNRGFKYTIGASINQNITLNLMKGREILTTKTQNLLSSDVNNGNGVTRNVLLIGDSTVNGSNISTPLKAVFDADVMNINLIGTLGASGVKHEGRGGWTVNDYATIGRRLYVVPVSGITTAPSVGAVYKQIAGNNFTVTEVNITGGNGYFSVSMASGSVDLSVNGTLTKVSGNGDSIINYTGSYTTSANPFYNPATQKFDLGYYLTQTGQALSSGDWIGFQLGINDVFGITDLNSATTKVNTMISQMNKMIANIHSYNANIRIAICVTFPPADQDAFGFSYTNGQLSEMYTKTGLVTWQSKLIETFDNETSRSNNVFLVSAHLNLDVDYNYPSSEVAVNSRNSKTITMQTNGVHPSANGYAQIADMYAGLIKYFG